MNLVLSELIRIAADTGCTIAGNLHTNRSASLDPRNRVAHQLEFTRIARSALLIGQTKTDEEDHRTIVHFSANYTRRAPAIRAYIHGEPLEIGGKVMDVPVMSLNGPVTADAGDLFLKQTDTEGAIKDAKTKETKTEMCMREIVERHMKLGYPRVARADAFTEALKGFVDTVKKPAKERLGITTKYAGGADGIPPHHMWEFPDDMTQDEAGNPRGMGSTLDTSP